MTTMTLADGREVARPSRVVARDGYLVGYFHADEDSQYDQWLCWSDDCPEARADLAREKIEIED